MPFIQSHYLLSPGRGATSGIGFGSSYANRRGSTTVHDSCIAMNIVMPCTPAKLTRSGQALA